MDLKILGLTAASVGIVANNIFKIIKKHKQKNTKRLWARPWLLRRGLGKDVGYMAFNELELEDPRSFRNFTRMPQSVFFKLLQKVELRICRQNTVFRESIPAKIRLLLTLRFLATGESFQNLSYSFRISVPAISQIVHETARVIYEELKGEYLKMPQSEEEWLTISAKFQKLWNFPYCLGALDGKHIAFRAKSKEGSFYFNYKGFHSIILLALVDAQYNFIYVHAGCNGRVNDASVLTNSSLGEAIEKKLLNFPNDSLLPGTEIKVPYVIVADDAFKLTTRLVKPFRERSELQENIFNYRLSRARRVSENAFGILANRFQVLQKEINLSVDKVEQIVLTTCVLHNFIQRESTCCTSLVDQEDTSNITFTPGEWRQQVSISRLQKSKTNKCTSEAISVRNKYMEYFNSTGFIPWQWEAVKKFNF